MLIHIQHETERTFYDNLKFEINYDSSEGKKFKHLKWIYVAWMVRLSESSDVNLSNGFLLFFMYAELMQLLSFVIVTMDVGMF